MSPVRRGGRVREYLRQQHLALIALALALTGGTAYALGGSNTVFSDDIVNGNVRSADVQDNGVRSADVRDDTAAGGGLTAADLRPGSVGSDEVVDGSLTASDVDESSLGLVPAARLGGTGASTVNPPAVRRRCGTTYVDCGFVTLDLPQTTRVLITAGGTSDSPGSDAQGFCRLATSQGSLTDTYAYIEDQSNWGLTTVAFALGRATSTSASSAKRRAPTRWLTARSRSAPPPGTELRCVSRRSAITFGSISSLWSPCSCY